MRKINLWVGLALLVALVVAPAYFKNYGIHLFTTWLVFIIATMGLNLTVGYAVKSRWAMRLSLASGPTRWRYSSRPA